MRLKSTPISNVLQVPVYLPNKDGEVETSFVQLIRLRTTARQSDVLKDIKLAYVDRQFFAVHTTEAMHSGIHVYSDYAWDTKSFKVERVGPVNADYFQATAIAGHYFYAMVYRALFLLGLISSAQERSALAESQRISAAALAAEEGKDAEEKLLDALYEKGMTLSKAKKIIEMEIRATKEAVKVKAAPAVEKFL